MSPNDNSNTSHKRKYRFALQVEHVKHRIREQIARFEPPLTINEIMYYRSNLVYSPDSSVDYKTVFNHLEENGDITLQRIGEDFEKWIFIPTDQFGKIPIFPITIDIGRPINEKIASDAQIMSEIYIKLYVVENSLRRCIINELSSEFGDSWWDSAIPSSVKKRASQNMKDARKIYHKISVDEPIYYSLLSDLKNIIDENWRVFKSIFKNKDIIRGKLTELEIPRNAIGHSIFLPENERIKFKDSVDTILEILSN